MAQEEVFDIVVVGYGAAGAAAAIEAARLGQRVLLVEKMAQPGGISILSAGGVRVAQDPQAAFAYLQHTCGGRTPDDVLRALAQGMCEVAGWLRELAVLNGARIEVTPARGNYPFPGTEALAYAEVAAIPGFGEPGGPQARGWLDARPLRPGCFLFKLLLDHVEAHAAAGRIVVRTGTRVERLLQRDRADGAREVVGVRLRRGGEPAAEVHARRAVILACGGFEADAGMLSRHTVSGTVLPGSFRGNTGDGIRMAQAAGADLWHLWHLHGPYGLRHPDPAYPFGIYVKLLPMWTPGAAGPALPPMAWIVVDQAGRRFADEYPPYLSDTGIRQFDHFDPGRAAHTRLPSFLLFDDAGRRLYPMGRSITNDPEAHYAWSEDNLAEVENGLLLRADTIEALAGALGLPASELATTIARWNADCAAGTDTQFGRRPETMRPLATPPFFAARLWPVVINTQGGPVHDARQRVLDPFGAPIPRLYAAGELGSVFGHVYMAGGNLAECLIGGRTAAVEAAGEA